MLILTYNCLENMCPDYLCNQFNFVHKVHNHINKKAYYQRTYVIQTVVGKHFL